MGPVFALFSLRQDVLRDSEMTLLLKGNEAYFLSLICIGLKIHFIKALKIKGQFCNVKNKNAFIGNECAFQQLY